MTVPELILDAAGSLEFSKHQCCSKFRLLCSVCAFDMSCIARRSEQALALMRLHFCDALLFLDQIKPIEQLVPVS